MTHLKTLFSTLLITVALASSAQATTLFTRVHTRIEQEAGQQAADRYTSLVIRKARQYKIPVNTLIRLIAVESEFKPRERSSAGAVGLMQVMPLHFRSRGISSRYWYDPETNLDVGCRIFTGYRDLMARRYRGLPERALYHRTLVAYNMGPYFVVSRGIYRSRYSNLILNPKTK